MQHQRAVQAIFDAPRKRRLGYKQTMKSRYGERCIFNYRTNQAGRIPSQSASLTAPPEGEPLAGVQLHAHTQSAKLQFCC